MEFLRVLASGQTTSGQSGPSSMVPWHGWFSWQNTQTDSYTHTHERGRGARMSAASLYGAGWCAWMNANRMLAPAVRVAAMHNIMSRYFSAGTSSSVCACICRGCIFTSIYKCSSRTRQTASHTEYAPPTHAYPLRCAPSHEYTLHLRLISESCGQFPLPA
jgi:hypothetical protein